MTLTLGVAPHTVLKTSLKLKASKVDFLRALKYPSACSKANVIEPRIGTMAMKHLKSGILGVVCFILACWYFTSIGLSYSEYAGEVLIVNMATEPVQRISHVCYR